MESLRYEEGWRASLAKAWQCPEQEEKLWIRFTPLVEVEEFQGEENYLWRSAVAEGAGIDDPLNQPLAKQGSVASISVVIDEPTSKIPSR